MPKAARLPKLDVVPVRGTTPGARPVAPVPVVVVVVPP